ncbi:MAG: p-hydroxybenzoate: octaprenyltransferase [Candidatus Brocadia sinica]|uniref:4-hydroxybenzoate octaprenyltransferase n=1 Tax=Candidatus Brocadia sinica JPN1 TaxID=1197129 RepID=A0ABQ0JSL7_9BACT|nr:MULTISPECIES: UbiA-like polyprenyltransferase [Brocadia]KXK28347.1 MAG: p-hydroxybenzoate: octaprenyltransferase [Candidatus Brocadia sinica]GAN31722.1 4-hydroxybenzoate octaprenyltransferase [Candidatus Brocadia sinica JPN1]GIK12548.1 MAG: 4-hydroxybenzoate octaprenyltransferase [Candidatus Brocadia sinica]GJQ17500.1 MAG: 4-hydroxybenzoate octaprenyltransferase [Candidatus Brocadia sinica]
MSETHKVKMGFSYLLKKITSIFDLIKFSHTIFSFPFAVMSAFLAAGGMPGLKQLLLILAALIAARSAAMSFNRLVDTSYDIHNPRTAYRVELQKKIGRKYVWIFTFLCVILFIICAWLLNRLAFYMSPLAILVVFGYSYTKRFTHLSHFVLGIALGLSPLGAWVGIQGTLAAPPFLLSLAVVLWTAGFDIIYACQDVEHDIKSGLYSLPKKLGIKGALILSAVLHLFMVGVLLAVSRYTDLGILYTIGVCIVAALLIYEHSLVRPKDLSKINTAFFTVNGIISVGLMGITLLDIFVR